MPNIDEKFKDNTPEKTVENIINILDTLGIKLNEQWFESGVDSCYSLRVTADGGFVGTNGKGVTPALARASAYGEFVERLQTGLFLYKYQSLEFEEGMFLHKFAPDAKYVTKDELVADGEWMDYVVATYGGRLNREEIAEQCAMYAGSDSILTLPFYSIFEDKYVYLPASFVEHIYCANGCCVGNSRDEAWIHAMSEIMERHANTHMLITGEVAPAIPDEVLKQYDAVYSVIEQLRALDYDVTVLDYSLGFDYPVVATRIINKKNGGYMVNVGADPVLEIALKRTLTEVFQGKSLESFARCQTYGVLRNVKEINRKHNVLNQLETSNGKFTRDFFCEELCAKRAFKPFTDNSSMSNKELLPKVLKMYKDMGRPVYIRNYSYLGFPCYMFVVPGFSESRGVRLNEFLQEYYFADKASRVFRYPERATNEELEEALLFDQIIYGARSRMRNYLYLSGLTLDAWDMSKFLVLITYAYAAYRLGRQKELCGYISQAAAVVFYDDDKKNYVECLAKYFALKYDGMDEEKILCLLKKFYTAKAYDRLVGAKEDGSFFDGLLVRCDFKSCEDCSVKERCRIASVKALMGRAGEIYSRFTDGQSKENFKLDFEI